MLWNTLPVKMRVKENIEEYKGMLKTMLFEGNDLNDKLSQDKQIFPNFRLFHKGLSCKILLKQSKANYSLHLFNSLVSLIGKTSRLISLTIQKKYNFFRFVNLCKFSLRFYEFEDLRNFI